MKITNAASAPVKQETANIKKGAAAFEDPAAAHIPANTAMVTDSVTISSDARALLTIVEKEQPPTEQAEGAAKFIAMLEQHKKQTEGVDSAFDDFAKCIKIALRIMNGDQVPLQDHRFLAEKEPALYENAIMMRRHNEDPEKHDSLLDDEKKDTAAADISSSEATVPDAQPAAAAATEGTPQQG